MTATRTPDTEWFSAAPTLLRDLRGTDAQVVIDKLDAAVASYPHPDVYRAWPGPNSNTFVAHLGRAIPELRVTLPSNAIGKDYLPAGEIFAHTPSGTGYQASVAGLFGVIAGGDEGFGNRPRSSRGNSSHLKAPTLAGRLTLSAVR